MATKLTPEQIKKLPKAAQNYIAALEASNIQLQREAALSSGNIDPSIMYHMGIGAPRGIPDNSVVSFRLIGGKIDVYASEDRKSLTARGAGLANQRTVICPQTGNSFEVYFEGQ